MTNVLLDEIWKPIHETKDRYFISNRGRFKHYKNGICNLKETKTGLLFLHLKISDKDITLYQYRTMYKYFVSDKHLDDYIVLLKENCELKPENLYLVSKKKSNRVFFGKNVYVYDTDLSLVDVCSSCAEAAEKFEIYNRSAVSRVCNNVISHANNYIFSYVELSKEDLVIKLNNIIMSYFNQGHNSESSEVRFEYSDIGVITKIHLSRKITYKTMGTKISKITFNTKDWLKHTSKSERRQAIIDRKKLKRITKPIPILSEKHQIVSIGKKLKPVLTSTSKPKKRRNIVAKGRLKSIVKPASNLSEQKRLLAYIYDGSNARFLFSDTIYNSSQRLKCSCENVRFHVKSSKLSYSLVKKKCYVILSHRDDELVKSFVRNNVPPGNIYKDEVIHRRYLAILNRCYCKTGVSYKNYGSKGITMFEDWRNDAREFEHFCVNNGFKKELEIDRINPDYGYEPWNIQFISHKENIMKMFKDRRRTKLQIKIDKIKYFRRKSNFFKNYKRGGFVDE